MPARRPPRPGRGTALTVLALALLAGPSALAFFSGGYFGQTRLVAACVACVLLAVTATVVPDLRGLRGPAALGLGALAALAGWTALSITWAPLAQPAVDALVRALLYLAACAAAVLVFADRRRARLIEPVAALGALVVVGYGLVGRMLPDLVPMERTASAGGRLDQPLTYWNAQGALAAMGLVLCARLAGDRTRALWLRAAAAAAAAPLGAGVYLTFSRGSLSALGVGVLVLLALAPSWPQLRAGALALEAAVAASVAAALLPAVQSGEGDAWTREGAIMLVALLAVMAVAAALQVLVGRAEARDALRLGPLPGARPLARAAVAVAIALTLLPFATAVLSEDDSRPDPAFGATAARLGSLDSDRYGYWRVAVRTWADDPVLGIGAGGFRVAWLRERDSLDPTRDAHSVLLEHLSQLGIVGLSLLLAVFAAVVAAARRLTRSDPALVAGPAAALAVWGAHAAIDWDWQMPALTLVAAVLAGGLLARAGSPAAAG